MKSLAVHQTDGDKASRKRWIIGLSVVALLLAYVIADDCIEHYKRFNKANRLATGHVVESDPGTPGHSGPDGDPGDPAWSHYQFNVGEKVYGGSTDYELAVGETIRIRYNSSDPRFSHAEDDDTGFAKVVFVLGIALFTVLYLLVAFVRNKNRVVTT
jgi:hypothetical protein